MNTSNGSGSVQDKVKILIVDDLDENLLSLEAILDSLGQMVIRAKSGEEAMRLALRHDFALMLIDVIMPGIDGFETASLLKRHHRTRDVPIIFLTAAEDTRDATFRGYAAGAADYITKPFDPWVLRAKVLVFIDLYRKNRMLGDIAARLAAVEEQMRRLIPGSAAPPGSSDAGLGTVGTVAPDAAAHALVELTERIARLQSAVRALFPVDDLIEAGPPGGLAPPRAAPGSPGPPGGTPGGAAAAVPRARPGLQE